MTRSTAILTSTLTLVLFGTIAIALRYPDWVARAVTSAPDLALSALRDLPFPKIFVLVLGVTLVLQSIMPARKTERTLSVGFLQDVIWFLYEHVLLVFVIVTYVAWLKFYYTQHLSFLTIDSLGSFPAWSRLLIGLLLTDFLMWFQHYLNHRVPILWKFHKLHHSQRELNFFTDYRYHVFEYLVRHTVLAIPFLILSFEIPTILAIAIFRSWYSRFYHANLRTNLGLLRYVLVTPQSHRVHHSTDSEHQDQNFGSMLSIWDFIFRTQFRIYDVYPATGVTDAQFPVEQNAKWWHLPVMPIIQMLYPVQEVIRDYRRTDDGSAGAA